MLIGTSTVKNFTDKAENIDSSNDDTCTSDDGPCAVEYIGMLKGTVENGHFGNETAESRQTEVGKTGDNVTDSQERHDLHQTTKFANITRMGTAVNHTDKGKKQGGHQSVAEHLQYGTRGGRLVHHQDGEEYQSTV